MLNGAINSEEKGMALEANFLSRLPNHGLVFIYLYPLWACLVGEDAGIYDGETGRV